MPKKTSTARRRKNPKLDVGKVLKEFQEYEESKGHRSGPFKIDAPFDEALKTILKAKPGSKKTRRKKPC